MLNGITLGIVMIVILLFASLILTLLINIFLVPLFKTPKKVLSEIVDLMTLRKEDHIVDLGSGDGEILFKAYRISNCKCTGYDISPIMLILAKTKRIVNFPLSKDFNFEAKDIFKAELSNFTKAYCYLDKKSIKILEPKLKQFVKEGKEIYSYRYEIEGIKNKKKIILQNGESLYIYKG
ncbi:MAG: class I SAM-dependent methyltransferase [Candidatus Dojkabacteria bacterium]|nr:class I SAM-dependent methyltransferase [Candidatus Dojkabacteria bacterium]MDD4561083.1 class I SAM-dependent methyltransferase [Candidatus Dojkabacteria bacterium]